jgi:hypothetical protein
MIEIEKNFDLGKIHFDLHKELNLAAQIIIKDITGRVDKGVDLSNSALKPLKSTTIKAKRRKGSPRPETPLYDTGRMAGRGSKKGIGGRGLYITDRATKAKQQVTLSTARDRREIGNYHNEGAGRLPKREWFGISKDAENSIDKMVEMRIERMLESA